jgi:hypothetical protein
MGVVPSTLLPQLVSRLFGGMLRWLIRELMHFQMARMSSGLMRGVCGCVLRQPVGLPVRCAMRWLVLCPVRCVVECLLVALLDEPVRWLLPCILHSLVG